jgi:hypothetical protein
MTLVTSLESRRCHTVRFLFSFSLPFFLSIPFLILRPALLTLLLYTDSPASLNSHRALRKHPSGRYSRHFDLYRLPHHFDPLRRYLRRRPLCRSPPQQGWTSLRSRHLPPHLRRWCRLPDRCQKCSSFRRRSRSRRSRSWWCVGWCTLLPKRGLSEGMARRCVVSYSKREKTADLLFYF